MISQLPPRKTAEFLRYIDQRAYVAPTDNPGERDGLYQNLPHLNPDLEYRLGRSSQAQDVRHTLMSGALMIPSFSLFIHEADNGNVYEPKATTLSAVSGLAVYITATAETPFQLEFRWAVKSIQDSLEKIQKSIIAWDKKTKGMDALNEESASPDATRNDISTSVALSPERRAKAIYN